MPTSYATWFQARAGHPPHPWQAELGAHPTCRDRLIRIPTGLGKTLGVLAAWTYHRLIRRDPTWPRRLLLCLPMRVLVEQTEAAVSKWLADLGLLWRSDTDVPAADQVGVHLLLGGASARDWHLFPEHEAVLIGTQDMLLSRALNRGYGSARGRWPMEHALLRQDALWVLDEVQLMDVGLRTSAQLQAFHDPAAAHRPLASWWMSATLQPAWLDSVEFADRLPALRESALRIPPPNRTGPLFEALKPLTLDTLPAADDRRCEAWARRILAAHRDLPPTDRGRLTLALANTVDEACALYDALAKQLSARDSIDLRLVHSRFRGRERAAWRHDFLNREACTSGADRIIVATQVVEAGVDISADLLVTPLAPWPSLVQRFGRAARYGGTATILVLDRQLSDKAAAPYTEGELLAAHQVLEQLADVGLATLEALEERLAADDPDLLARLYPYSPLHTLTRPDYAELFDTGPDLTGSDLDVSRFIRSGDDRDLQVWWWPLDGAAPSSDLQPTREALCPVPVKQAREWLLDHPRAPQAWRWSYLTGAWDKVRHRGDLVPGQILLLDITAGGYHPTRGFLGPAGTAPVEHHPDDRRPPRDKDRSAALHAADNAQDHDELSELEHYQTIAFHGREAGHEAHKLAAALALPEPFPALLDLAARLHDLGKAHPVFQNAITPRPSALQTNTNLAKAPHNTWAPYARKGFRHELASALAIFEALYQACPGHLALLGPHRPLIDLDLLPNVDRPHLDAPHPTPTGVLAELAALDAAQLDLVLYLVCAHHGKVRGTWQQTPADQDAQPGPRGSMPLRGVLDGDEMPPVALADAGDTTTTLPALTLSLAPAALGVSARYGASWRERVDGLRRRHGDAMLVLLESLLRVADIRASRRNSRDPSLPELSVP